MMSDMISKSRARNVGLRIVTEDDAYVFHYEITRLVQMNTRKTSLSFAKTADGLDEAVHTVWYAHVAKRDDTELRHQRLCHVNKSTIN